MERNQIMKAAAYLNFKHNSKEVIKAYQEIFNAEVISEYFYDETMTQDQALIGKVYHAELKLGDLNLYLSDLGKDPSCDSQEFVVEFADESKAHECFKKLARDGEVISDFQKLPIGPKIAQVRDKFGIIWGVVIY